MFLVLILVNIVIYLILNVYKDGTYEVVRRAHDIK